MIKYKIIKVEPDSIKKVKVFVGQVCSRWNIVSSDPWKWTWKCLLKAFMISGDFRGRDWGQVEPQWDVQHSLFWPGDEDKFHSAGSFFIFF